MLMNLYLSLLMALLLGSASAHIEMIDPLPFRSKYNPNEKNPDYSMTSPLSSDGLNYPAKGYATPEAIASDSPTATLNAGSSYTVKLAGSATHEGGSCQWGLSYDAGKTIVVIHSAIGGCPLQSEYSVPIPADVPPADKALFFWTWQNKVGNREEYQNAALVKVVGSGSSSFSGPIMWRANTLPDGTCITKEGVSPVYPNPGPSVEYGGEYASSPPTAPTTLDPCSLGAQDGEVTVTASITSTISKISTGATGESIIFSAPWATNATEFDPEGAPRPKKQELCEAASTQDQAPQAAFPQSDGSSTPSPSTSTTPTAPADNGQSQNPQDSAPSTSGSVSGISLDTPAVGSDPSDENVTPEPESDSGSSPPQTGAPSATPYESTTPSTSGTDERSSDSDSSQLSNGSSGDNSGTPVGSDPSNENVAPEPESDSSASPPPAGNPSTMPSESTAPSASGVPSGTGVAPSDSDAAPLSNGFSSDCSSASGTPTGEFPGNENVTPGPAPASDSGAPGSPNPAPANNAPRDEDLAPAADPTLPLPIGSPSVNPSISATPSASGVPTNEELAPAPASGTGILPVPTASPSGIPSMPVAPSVAPSDESITPGADANDAPCASESSSGMSSPSVMPPPHTNGDANLDNLRADGSESSNSSSSSMSMPTPSPSSTGVPTSPDGSGNDSHWSPENKDPAADNSMAPVDSSQSKSNTVMSGQSCEENDASIKCDSTGSSWYSCAQGAWVARGPVPAGVTCTDGILSASPAKARRFKVPRHDLADLMSSPEFDEMEAEDVESEEDSSLITSCKGGAEIKCSDDGQSWSLCDADNKSWVAMGSVPAGIRCVKGNHSSSRGFSTSHRNSLSSSVKSPTKSAPLTVATPLSSSLPLTSTLPVLKSLSISEEVHELVPARSLRSRRYLNRRRRSNY